MDVVDLITNYLRDNRRLVVPAFGAFVVKESGEVLFSELLKTDDGVLRGLLADGGLSELECAGIIDRFIFDARNALSEKGSFPMGDFGALAIGGNGEIRFVSRAVKPAGQVAAKPDAAVPKTVIAAKTAVPKPDTSRSAGQTERPREAERPNRRRQPKKRGADWFMIAAVVVLLAAVAVIAYGYFCSAEQDDEAMMDSLRWQIEQPAATANE